MVVVAVQGAPRTYHLRIFNNPTRAEIPVWKSLKQPMFSLKIHHGG
jgi:hypothetical protein